jgi:DNA-directed RNA polymerase subunit M/transcription elongation factor TFIIS
MSYLRVFAQQQFEDLFPLKGRSFEESLFKVVQEEMRLTGCIGMDFFSFRMEYKHRLQIILENLTIFDSNLKSLLQGQVDDGNVSVIFAMNSKEWCPTLWSKENDDSEFQHDEIELREGTFSCANCISKGHYAKNTSHYEKQTRSADEPMTIFMHCHTCNKDYKFSS